MLNATNRPSRLMSRSIEEPGSGCTASGETLTGLAYVRWAAVVDLDPESDRAGLSSAVLPALQAVRHVSVFGNNRQIAPAASSTNWLMGNGWHSRSEHGRIFERRWAIPHVPRNDRQFARSVPA